MSVTFNMEPLTIKSKKYINQTKKSGYHSNGRVVEILRLVIDRYQNLKYQSNTL